MTLPGVNYLDALATWRLVNVDDRLPGAETRP